MLRFLKSLLLPKPKPDRWAELLASGLNPVLVRYIRDDGSWHQCIEWTADIQQFVDQPWPIVRDRRSSSKLLMPLTETSGSTL